MRLYKTQYEWSIDRELQNKKITITFFFLSLTEKKNESQDIHSLIYIVELKLQLFVLFLLSENFPGNSYTLYFSDFRTSFSFSLWLGEWDHFTRRTETFQKISNMYSYFFVHTLHCMGFLVSSRWEGEGARERLRPWVQGVNCTVYCVSDVEGLLSSQRGGGGGADILAVRLTIIIRLVFLGGGGGVLNYILKYIKKNKKNL